MMKIANLIIPGISFILFMISQYAAFREIYKVLYDSERDNYISDNKQYSREHLAILLGVSFSQWSMLWLVAHVPGDTSSITGGIYVYNLLLSVTTIYLVAYFRSIRKGHNRESLNLRKFLKRIFKFW